MASEMCRESSLRYRMLIWHPSVSKLPEKKTNPALKPIYVLLNSC